MDTSTAQAIHDLATYGRLSDESAAVVNDALGVHEDDQADDPGASRGKSSGASSGTKSTK